MNDEIILKPAVDPLKGNLYSGKVSQQIPFPIKEFYIVSNVPNSEIVRGGHAHKTREQIIFCLNGSFELHKDDGKKKWKILMNDPSRGEFLRRRVWHTMTNFSKNCVILVVANDYENDADYIRDYGEFLKYVKK